jgi:hypothetical protein
MRHAYFENLHLERVEFQLFLSHYYTENVVLRLRIIASDILERGLDS